MTRNRRIAGVVAGAVVFLLAPAVATRVAAAEVHISGAVVTIRSGDLNRLKPAGGTEKLSAGDKVNFGDRLRTDKMAVAVLRLPDIGRFVIGPASEVVLGKDKAAFDSIVDRGSIWVQSELPRGGRLNVTTGLATSGVRGTKFCVIADETGSEFSTCKGEIEVRLNDGRVIASRTGFYVAVSPDGSAPGAPRLTTQILRGTGIGKQARFDWCFHCHQVGGEVKKDAY